MKLIRETDTFDTFLNPHGNAEDLQVANDELKRMIGLILATS